MCNCSYRTFSFVFFFSFSLFVFCCLWQPYPLTCFSSGVLIIFDCANWRITQQTTNEPRTCCKINSALYVGIILCVPCFLFLNKQQLFSKIELSWAQLVRCGIILKGNIDYYLLFAYFMESVSIETTKL